MSNMNAQLSPLLVRASEAETLGTEPNQTWLLAEADAAGGTMNAVRTTLGRAVDGPPPHCHRLSSELFFMLDGALHVLVGEEIMSVRTGDFLLVPPNTTHAWGTPLVDRIRRGEAAPQEVLATQEHFDNHFVDSAIWRAAKAEQAGRVNLIETPTG